MQIPKTYIKVEELINLIKKNEKDNFIEEELLYSFISQLKTNDLSIKSLKKERDGAYNISDHLQAINKYQQEVKTGIRKSYIQLHMEEHFGITINKNDLKITTTGKNMRIKEKGNESFYEYYNADILDNLNIVTSEQELKELFKISKGTINTWRKKGIIKEYRKKIIVEIDGVKFRYRRFWLKHYDLENIRKELKKVKY